MNIVVLDGLQMNPGDLSWDPFSELGELKVYDRTSPDEVISRSKDAGILVINKVKITPAIIDALPQLKMIAVTATGFDNVDVSYASSKGIVMSNAISYSTSSVTQYVIACIFDALQGISEHDRSVKSGDWSQRDVFSYTLFPVNEWSTKTLGVIGLGNIGRSVADIGRRMGMRVIAWNRSVKEIDVPQLNLEEVIAFSDFLSMHLPLNDDTFHLMDEKRLNSMKKGACLINAGRGSLVDTDALLRSLDRDYISGAYLDVLPQEPPFADDPVINHPKIKVTPHIAWCSVQAREELMRQTVENIAAFLSGNPVRML